MTVSTHVLDTSAGRPAADVSVTLCLARPDDGWLEMESGATGADGRHRFAAPTPPGTYRLVFGTGRYFASLRVATFYPEVSVAFTIAEPAAGDPAAAEQSHEAHFHLPLLLSPFAYSTYRGS